MNRFTFSLEKVLDYRIRIEETKKETLARAAQRAQAEELLLQLLVAERNKPVLKTGRLNIIKIQQEESHNMLLDAKISQQKERLKAAKKAFTKELGEFCQAAKHRKMLESLRDKQWEEYYKEFCREEQKNLDEAGIASFCRQAE
ncbi:MAG: flagellar export protein FliJ [Syntrophomonadaceae bacterium]|jgi:flagellar FliJ protein